MRQQKAQPKKQLHLKENTESTLSYGFITPGASQALSDSVTDVEPAIL